MNTIHYYCKSLIKQHDENDCAVACIAMILRYHQTKFPYQTIRETIGTDYTGTNLHTLLEGVKKLGLNGEAYQTDPFELKNSRTSELLNSPFMALTKDNHFIVVFALKNQYILIADPAGEKKRVTYNEFQNLFSGTIVVFSKIICNDASKPYKKTHALQITKLLKKQRKPIIGITLASFVLLIIGIINSLIFQFVIEGNTGNHIHTAETDHDAYVTEIVEFVVHMNHPNVVFAILLALCIIQALVFVLRGLTVYSFSKNIHMELLTTSNEYLLAGKTSAVKSRLTGEYLSRLNDIDNIKSGIASSSCIIIVDVLVVILGLIVLSAINQTLSMIVILIFVTYFCVVAFFAPFMSKVSYKSLETEASAEAYYKEVVECFEYVKRTNAQAIINNNAQHKFNSKVTAKYLADRTKLFQQALLTSIESIGLVVVLWIGYFLIEGKQLSAGELISFYMLASFFITPMGDLLELQPLIQTGKASLERICDIFDMSQEESGKREFIAGDIEFKNVTFSYKTGFEVLTNLSLSIKKSEAIAIQSPSGSGKTTFAKLLLGLYSPQDGLISINGINIEDISKTELRNNVGYVSQAENYFSGTILDNLTLGSHHVGKDCLNTIFKFLGIENFIRDNFPLQFDTYIEENGRNLSGGQLQKLAIVRALVKRPKILILDEAVSNIDKNDAIQIINGIIRHNLTETLVLITHDNDLACLCNRTATIN